MAQGVNTTLLKFSAYADIGITVLRDWYVVVKEKKKKKTSSFFFKNLRFC